MWDEASLRKRRLKDRGAPMSQVERLYLVGGEDAQAFTHKDRKVYTGSNRGDCLGPILAPDWTAAWMYQYVGLAPSSHFRASESKDENACWSLPLAQKKELFGKANRVPVGGKVAEVTEKEGAAIRSRATKQNHHLKFNWRTPP